MPITAKISISSEANAALEKMLHSANLDFREGKISKHTLASWLILEGQRQTFGRSILKLRQANLDPILVLKAKISEIRAARAEKAAP